VLNIFFCLVLDYKVSYRMLGNNLPILFCRYDPSTGIYGMDFYVVLERAGYRVARRRRCKSRVGIQHRVTKEDAMKWFQVKYEGVILNKSQANTSKSLRANLVL
jgi:hypothetical protein